MARGALGWNVHQLSEAAGVGVNTISRFENGSDALLGTVAKIKAAFEAQGLVFTDGDEPLRSRLTAARSFGLPAVVVGGRGLC